MYICMGKVSLWGIEFRVQGAGCRWGSRLVVNAEGIRRIVSMTAPSTRSTPNIARAGLIRGSVGYSEGGYRACTRGSH